MLTAAVRVPAAVGVKVTLIVQLLFAATELPQVFVSAKSPGLVPVMLTLVMLKLALPVLLSFTLCAALVVPTFWLLNVRLVGERLAAPAAVPVPVRLTVCGLPAALSETLTVAVRVPAAVGVKVTLIVQLLFAATELPQVFDSAKSPVLVPVMLMLVMLKLEFPVLLKVTLCAALVVPTFWLLNVRLVGERLAVPAAVPVPVRLTVCGLPAALSEMLSVAVRVPAAVGVNVTLIVQLPFAATELPQALVSA
jgi:hypothetical protein